MTIRISTGLRDAISSMMSAEEALAHGRIYVYSGVQPSSADDAPSGNLLHTFTNQNGAYTAPVKATATIQIDAAGGGSVDTVKVGGSIPLIGAAVSWNSSKEQTASDLSAAINAYQNALGITATVSTDTVTLHAPYFLGATANGLTLAVTTTTISPTVSASFASGTDAANGLNFQHPAASGVLTKETDDWQSDGASDGTAGWFRYVAGGSSVSGSSTTDVRFDGTVGTATADLNLDTTSVVTGVEQTITSFTVTLPAS